MAGPPGPDGRSEPPIEAVGAGIGIEIKAKLSTLLGLDVHPGELTGYGPIRSAVVAERVRARSRGRWRWVLCDDTGYLLDAGTTRARPPGYPRREHTDQSIVEIRVPLRLLKDLLDNDTAGPWTTVVAEIATQHAIGRPPPDPRRRHPDAALRRYVQAAHPTCYGGHLQPTPKPKPRRTRTYIDPDPPPPPPARTTPPPVEYPDEPPF